MTRTCVLESVHVQSEFSDVQQLKGCLPNHINTSYHLFGINRPCPSHTLYFFRNVWMSGIRSKPTTLFLYVIRAFPKYKATGKLMLLNRYISVTGIPDQHLLHSSTAWYPTSDTLLSRKSMTSSTKSTFSGLSTSEPTPEMT
jgi:hypothetical protein